MDLFFTIDAAQYNACYIGDRDGKPGNWWHCEELGIYIAVPGEASQADIIAAFVAAADVAREGNV